MSWHIHDDMLTGHLDGIVGPIDTSLPATRSAAKLLAGRTAPAAQLPRRGTVP